MIIFIVLMLINSSVSQSNFGNMDTSISDLLNKNFNDEQAKLLGENYSFLEKPYLPTDLKVVLEGWLQVRSQSFMNQNRFPILETEEGQQKFNVTQDDYGFLLNNPLYSDEPLIFPNSSSLYVRMSADQMFWSNKPENKAPLGVLRFKSIVKINWVPDLEFPQVEVTDSKDNVFSLRGYDEKKMTTYFCHILAAAELGENDKCRPTDFVNVGKTQVVVNTVTQPMIVIPLPSKKCNEGWNYSQKGDNWECTCKEGREQSPIDLPPRSQAIGIDIKPLFSYKKVSPKMDTDHPFVDVVKGSDNIIYYEKETIKIKHPDFGKLVTVNGAVYKAQEIVFHTPSEHKIDGTLYDMEMQIIHKGKSVGDTNKRAILSFFFRAKPGVFNKFIEKLNFFDLPNPMETERFIDEELYIPNTLLTTEDDDIAIMKPFSFYTYQGSITTPPCTENTIHYVASEPLELSNTAIQMFKESLRIPDKQDAEGNIIISNSISDNNRNTQPLNGRAVFHYDHTQFGCDMEVKKKTFNTIKPTGHYEKRENEVTQYVFVAGKEPSGMPGSFVVTEAEAQGKEI